MQRFFNFFKKFNSDNKLEQIEPKKSAEMHPKDGYSYYLYIFMDIGKSKQDLKEISDQLHEKLINQNFLDLDIKFAAATEEDIRRQSLILTSISSTEISGIVTIKISNDDYKKLPTTSKKLTQGHIEILAENLASNGGSFEMDPPAWFYNPNNEEVPMFVFEPQSLNKGPEL